MKTYSIIVSLIVATINFPCFAETPEQSSTTANKHKDINIGGFMQWDYDYFDGLYNDDEIGSEAKLRRARLIVKGKLPDDFSYVLMPHYNNTKKEVNLLNAFIKYQGFNHADITVGRFKDPFGMEALSSALWTPTIERSMIFNKPNPVSAGLFIDSGIMVSKNYRRTTWALALVEDGLEDDNGKDLFGFTGRLSYAPILSAKQALHLGASHAIRSAEENTPFQIKEPLGVATANKLELVNTQIDGLSQTGLEFAFRYRGFSIQNEYVSSRIDSSNGDVSLTSYYTLATYTPGGEPRRYAKGVFGPTIPKGKSAVELVAKFENNEVEPSQDITSEAQIITLGINVYFNKQVKLALNYVKATTDNFGTPNSGRALAARMQLKF